MAVGGFERNLRCAGHDPFLASVALQSEHLLATRFKDRYNAYLEQAQQHPSGTRSNRGTSSNRRKCCDSAAVVLERAEYTVVVILCVTASSGSVDVRTPTVPSSDAQEVGDSGDDAEMDETTPERARATPREAHRNLVPADTLPLQVWSTSFIVILSS